MTKGEFNQQLAALGLRQIDLARLLHLADSDWKTNPGTVGRWARGESRVPCGVAWGLDLWQRMPGIERAKLLALAKEHEREED